MSDYGFKFNLGDVVTYKAVQEEQLFVVGRSLEECPGGIQRHYIVRSHLKHRATSGHFSVNEFELILWEEEKFMKDVTQRIKEWFVDNQDFQAAANVREIERLMEKIQQAAEKK